MFRLRAARRKNYEIWNFSSPNFSQHFSSGKLAFSLRKQRERKGSTTSQIIRPQRRLKIVDGILRHFLQKLILSCAPPRSALSVLISEIRKLYAKRTETTIVALGIVVYCLCLLSKERKHSLILLSSSYQTVICLAALQKVTAKSMNKANMTTRPTDSTFVSRKTTIRKFEHAFGWH